MALTFTNSNKAAAAHGVKLLIYGDAGAGKTRLVATAPNPVLISAESGLLSLAGFSIPVIEIQTIQDLTDVYAWATKSEEANAFETICIDSLSEIAEVILQNALKQVKDPRQAYGELTEKMMATVRAFRDLKGKHIYMSAKMQRLTDDDTGVTRYIPSMPGKRLGPDLPYFFDEVFRLGIGKTPEGNQFRFLQTQLDTQYVAKDRSGTLAAVEHPDLTHIISKINNGATPNG